MHGSHEIASLCCGCKASLWVGVLWLLPPSFLSSFPFSRHEGRHARCVSAHTHNGQQRQSRYVRCRFDRAEPSPGITATAAADGGERQTTLLLRSIASAVSPRQMEWPANAAQSSQGLGSTGAQAKQSNTGATRWMDSLRMDKRRGEATCAAAGSTRRNDNEANLRGRWATSGAFEARTQPIVLHTAAMASHYEQPSDHRITAVRPRMEQIE